MACQCGISDLVNLRVPNIMKHVCVAIKIGDDAKDGAEHIANMVKPADKVSADFDRNPWGWHEFWPMTLSLPLPIFAIWPAGSFAS